MGSCVSIGVRVDVGTAARTGYDLFCGLAARSITRKGKCYSVGVRTIDVCVPASLPCPQEGGTSPLG